MGWPDKLSTTTREIQAYENKKTQLSLNNGCILWGSRVIIPSSLRKMVLADLHQSHPGATKMKMLARSYVWWPRIDSDIEQMVTACPGCQSVQKEQSAVFLHPWEHTARPWERVHLDFAGPFRGKYFMVMVDSHSKWPEVITMHDITSQATIIELAKIFSRWGNPVQLVTDNGAQLTSKEFESFLTRQGVKHIRTAPYRPQTNGLAERMVQTVKNCLKAYLSGGDQRPIELQLASFLLQYRNTPHSTTGVAPVEAMLGRKMRTRLDLLKPHPAERVLDAQAQQMMKHNQRLPEYQVGDKVLVRNYAGGQKWKTGTVLGRTGPVSYQVTVEGLVWSRHAGQLLPLTSRCQNQENKELCLSYEPTSIRNQKTTHPTSSTSGSVPRTGQTSKDDEDSLSGPNPVTRMPLPDAPAETDPPAAPVEPDLSGKPTEAEARETDKNKTSDPLPQNSRDKSNSNQLAAQHGQPEAKPGSATVMTRTGRTCRRPGRFKDFVMC